MNKSVVYIFWASRILAALIMVQSLFFKFSASSESVYIFSTIGMEPWGRIGIGIGELIASILLFIPGFIWLGAFLAFNLMAGAIFFHLTSLGIAVQGDGGYLFFLAVVVLISSAVVLILDKDKALTFLANYLKIKVSL